MESASSKKDALVWATLAINGDSCELVHLYLFNPFRYIAKDTCHVALDTTVRVKRKRLQNLFVSWLSYLDKQGPAASKEAADTGSQAVCITYQGL